MASASTSSLTQSWTSSVSATGEFKRKDPQFRNKVTADGSSGFQAERDRYHLYVSYACPWAHRTLIMRKLKGLEDVISYSTVSWILGRDGWSFDTKEGDGQPDPVNGFHHISQVYFLSKPDYVGNFTVPVLFDKQTKQIVNNESPEIIRMLNSEFNAFCATPEQAALDFYPEPLRAEIDEVNSWVYPRINNGVYRCGFASTQEAYDIAFGELFEALDRVEAILSKKRYLISPDRITEADIRLFTTLIRFDAVYVAHFKCNLRRIADYPHMQDYVRELYQLPGIKETVNWLHVKNHYFQSHKQINPHGIVPRGPVLDFDTPHQRAKLS